MNEPLGDEARESMIEAITDGINRIKDDKFLKNVYLIVMVKTVGEMKEEKTSETN